MPLGVPDNCYLSGLTLDVPDTLHSDAALPYREQSRLGNDKSLNGDERLVNVDMGPSILYDKATYSLVDIFVNIKRHRTLLL